MKSRRLSFITALALFAALAVPVLALAQKNNKQPRYYVFNLGAPNSGVPEPVGINDLGWISGGANLASNAVVHAELWVGVPLDLGTLGGPNSNIAWPNHSTHGEVVGIAETAQMNPYGEAWSCSAFFFGPDGYVCRGFAWQDGVMAELPPLPGGVDSYAAGVNDRGQVVGWAENGVLDPTCNNAPPFSQFLQFEAVIWGPKVGAITQLSPIPGDPDSAATAINDKGQVVGISGLCSNAVGGASAEHAVLWQNGVPTDLGNIGGHAWNTPVALNNRGEIVGFANTSGDENAGLSPTAFVWTQANGMHPLPALGSDQNSVAFDINEKGQIVGQSAGATLRAFLYQNNQILDLNSLIQPNSSLYLSLAQGINDSGEIVGTATDTSTGATVGFLAVPAYGGDIQSALEQTKSEDNLHKVVVPSDLRTHLMGVSQIAFGGAATK
jgi:probable HAF family extracellular repeat protein